MNVLGTRHTGKTLRVGANGVRRKRLAPHYVSAPTLLLHSGNVLSDIYSKQGESRSLALLISRKRRCRSRRSAPEANFRRGFNQAERCFRQGKARGVALRVDYASMFVGLNFVGIHSFAADPAHLGGSDEFHKEAFFTPQRPSVRVRRR